MRDAGIIAQLPIEDAVNGVSRLESSVESDTEYHGVEYRGVLRCGVPRCGVPRSTTVKPGYGVPKLVQNRGSGSGIDGTPSYTA